MPLSKVCKAPKTAEVSTDSTLKTDNKSVEKLLAPDFWQFRPSSRTFLFRFPNRSVISATKHPETRTGLHAD